ncbi:MAG: hypothetical protein QM820_57020 [Minicystis sp.]
MFNGYLTQEQLRELYEILVRLIRPGDEQAFLSHLPKKLLATLPGEHTTTFAARLYWRIQELNGIAALDDGGIPLREWLDTLATIFQGRAEVARLRALRDAIPMGPIFLRRIVRTAKRVALATVAVGVTSLGLTLYLRPATFGIEASQGERGGGSTARKPAESRLSGSSVFGWTYPGRWESLQSNLEWRIKSIESRADKLAVVIQVRNTKPSGDLWFRDFRRSPLSVIDAEGAYHEMMSTSDPPRGVSVNYEYWILQGGRVLDLVAEFQPLTGGVTEGKILYRSDNHATPLQFGVSRW